MAWGHSFSPDVWPIVRANLECWATNDLIRAISDDIFEHVYARANAYHARRAKAAEIGRLRDVAYRLGAIDWLVDRTMDLIEQTGLCDNGGWAVWIDREGYHTVSTTNESDN